VSYKVALATSDGKMVNQHFGHCRKWSIVEIDDDAYKFLELREIAPACQNGEHTDVGMTQAVEALSDCRAAVAFRAGPGATAQLTRRGVSVFEFGGTVYDAIDKLMKYYKKAR
jgi:predicted Fe-Mo cluster-binding NifX family protein